MMILTIKTDNPEAEIAIYERTTEIGHETWHAHRVLAETLHTKISELLKDKGKDWQDVQGIVCFAGPGSFTGLRIGLSVGNALAYGLSVPIVSTKGKSWARAGIKRLLAGDKDQLALPEYGAEAHITQQRK